MTGPFNAPIARSRGPWLLLVIGLLAGIAMFAVVALLMNIFERKQEARNPFFRVVELDDDTVDPAVWGKNFPLQYDDYLRTAEMGDTLYGGSEAVPHVPTDVDPRTFTARSKLEMIPELRRMWAGYAFARDFREARGHAYMLNDQMFTRRQEIPQPGTCLQCHASLYVAMKELGQGDLHAGFAALNKLPYQEAKEHVSHSVSCIDCHDSQTMQLRITRPAFAEGMRVLKAAEGIADYDVHTMATRQEMRSFVCAQCHVEYYFKGEGKTLVFPWQGGRKVDQILAYYDEQGHTDWVHADTGAKMLKAQHPEFEMWSQGTHSAAGVACADCHMPYKRVGALKISDHHVRSPLLNINHACQTCHHVSEDELRTRVETIQRRHVSLEQDALIALMDLIDDLKSPPENATPEQLETARSAQRKASFFVDFVEAENSNGFHAGHEAARILGEAIDAARTGQLQLRGWKPQATEEGSGE